MIQWPKTLSDPSYEPSVLGAIAAGNFEHTFVPITIEANGHRGVFSVSQDALKIEGIRINASAILQQHIADMIGASLVTPRIFDQMWKSRAITVLPCTQPITSSIEGMVKHSACVDSQIAKLGGIPDGRLAQTVGKTWVLSNKLTSAIAMNMGWHLEKQIVGIPFDPAPTLSGAHMIQSPGTRHGPMHADYSQICLYVANECTVDDQPTTFASVAQSPLLAALVSHEGVLKVLRQPGAPEIVTPPEKRSKPAGVAAIAMTAFGATVGGAIGGPVGAVVGGAVGLAVDAVHRKMTS